MRATSPITGLYSGLPALGTNVYLGIPALGTKVYPGLAAPVAKAYTFRCARFITPKEANTGVLGFSRGVTYSEYLSWHVANT